MRRRAALLLTAIAAALVLSSGVALAINTIRCETDDFYCRGTEERDLMKGTDGDNYMYARAGGDTLRGFAGDDLLNGQAGNDKVFAGPGDDYLQPGSGNDALDGGQGDDDYDFLVNTWGRDTITDSTLSDNDQGSGNRVQFYTGSSTDLTINLVSTDRPEVTNASGTSTVNWSGNVIDKVYSRNRGNDTITGNAAANIIGSQRGTDTISGGGGDDYVYVTDGTGGDVVDCGEDAEDDDAVFYDTGDKLTNCETLLQ